MEKRLALPMGKIKIPRFLYLIVVVLVLLILLIVGFNFIFEKFGSSWKSRSSVNKNTVVVTPEPGESVSGGTDLLVEKKRMKISEKLVFWLEKQRDPDRGIYSENESCGEDGICSGNNESNRSGLSVMAGEIRYEKKVNQHIIDDLKKYLDRDKVQVIQSNYLLCNFLYDLYSYPGASNEVKDLSKQLCFDVTYEMFKDDYNSLKESADIDKLSDQVLQKLKQISTEKESVSSVDESTFNTLKKYGFYVSEFATRYKWKKDNEDYKGFLISANKFLDLYGNKKNEFKDGEVCSLALGLVDMGESKNLPELKNYGKNIYKNEVFGDKVTTMSLRQMLTCGLAAEKLNDKDTLNRVLMLTISNFYNEKHGAVGQQFHGYTTNVYDVKNNGVFLMLLNSSIINNDQ